MKSQNKNLSPNGNWLTKEYPWGEVNYHRGAVKCYLVRRGEWRVILTNGVGNIIDATIFKVGEYGQWQSTLIGRVSVRNAQKVAKIAIEEIANESQ